MEGLSMTHLKIEQNNSAIEQVSSAVITKLYELAISGDLDQSSNLVGRLQTAGAYADEVNYLTQQYNELYINANKLYVRFEDPIAQQWCVQQYSSDGIGCSVEDLAAVTSLDGSFKTSGIVSFNEFRYFTGVTIINIITENVQNANTTLKYITLPNSITRIGPTSGYGGGFYGYSALESINIPSNCILNDACFRFCTSLKSITFGENTQIGIGTFEACSQLSNVDLGRTTQININAFLDCSNLTSIYIPNSVTYIGNSFLANSSVNSITFEEGGDAPLVLEGGTSGYKPGVFRLISSQKIVFPSRLSELKNNALGCTSAMTYVFTSTTPPSVTGNGQITEDITNSIIYVPNSALTTYQATTGFDAVSSSIKGYKIYQYVSSAWTEVSSPTEVQIMTAADNILNSTPTGSATDGSLALVIQS